MPRDPEAPEQVAAIQRRDPDALEQIARTHMPLLLRVARSLGLREEDAYDAVQDCLLVFLRRAGQYDGRSPVRSWLLGILYKKCQERRRAVARDEPASELDDRFDSNGRWARPPQSPEHYTATAQAMTWLAECLDELPDRRRLAFQLRDVAQLDTAEICKILEITPNNVGVLVFRARAALRECMESRGIRGAADVAM